MRMQANRLVRLWAVLTGVAALAVEARPVEAPVIRIPVIQGPPIAFERLRAPGLSQTRVAQIVQDEKGFLWFGTQNGLHRYDGYDLKAFRHDPESGSSLSGVYIYSLSRDRSGFLWVGSDEFLDRVEPGAERSTRFSLDAGGDRRPAGTRVVDTFEDEARALWVCTRAGLYRIDPETGRSRHFSHDPSDPGTIGSNDVKMAGLDRDGGFWVATNAGLDEFDRSTGRVVRHIALPETPVRLIFIEDRRGVFWIICGQEGQLLTLDRGTGRLQRIVPTPNTPLPANDHVLFSTMIEDRDGTMWFGTDNRGILQFDRDRHIFRQFAPDSSRQDSLADAWVTSLFQDREGLIWVGFHQEAPAYLSLHSPLFRKIDAGRGKSALVSALLSDGAGRLWLSANREVRRQEPGAGRFLPLPALAGNEVTAMVEAPPGVFWFGTSGQGMKKYDPRKGTVVSFAHGTDDRSLCDNHIESLGKGRNGEIWAATWDGLARLDPKAERFTCYRPIGAPAELDFHTVTAARTGKIWAGSNLGLYQFDPGTGRFTPFLHDPRTRESLSNNRVNAIHEAADGSLWIGTQNGLDHFSPAKKQFTHFSQRQGLSGSLVSCILQDDTHHLWMSTNAGISRLDPGTGQFRTFGTADGLPGQDMSGWGTCLQAPTGEMFFAGFAGAAAVFPKNVGTDPYVPPVVFTDLLLQRPSASPVEIPVINRSEVTLEPWQNEFSLGFTALSLSHPAANRYRYRMPGWQDGWTEVSSDKRRATFLGLSPGTYTIQVQGATRHGAWSEPGALLRIKILPPWWGTWTFRTVVLGMVGLMLLLLYRARIARIRREYQARFEERADERARIARELHDTLLQGFQGLMFRLQAVRDLLPAHPDRAIPVLETALERGENAIDEARHAVSSLRSSTTLEADLERMLSSLAADVANEEHRTDVPAVVIALSGGVRPVSPHVLHELRQIANEVLRNAFRHAQAKRIDMRIAYRQDSLVLSLRDDGVGIEESIIAAGQKAGHWGLPGMRERTVRIGGKLTMTSRPGRGTDVTVSLPAAVAYERFASPKAD